ncbi:MAG: hypothetical protein ACFE0I_04530 [Elainellaceae cyanobacterium]
MSSVDSQPTNLDTSFSDAVMGAAIFDFSGLPKEYYTTNENPDISWVQTIFQALGLRSLIMSSLQLDGFHHAVIHGTEHSAVVVKQNKRYIALLIRKSEFLKRSDIFLSWMQEFEPSTLKADIRFSTV